MSTFLDRGQRNIRAFFKIFDVGFSQCLPKLRLSLGTGKRGPQIETSNTSSTTQHFDAQTCESESFGVRKTATGLHTYCWIVSAADRGPLSAPRVHLPRGPGSRERRAVLSCMEHPSEASWQIQNLARKG